MIRVVVLFSLYILTCFGNVSFSQTFEQSFQNVLDSIQKATPESIGSAIHVSTPAYEISWTGASGLSEKNTQHILDPEQPVLIASNTKTYVAAAVLKLVEMGSITLLQSLYNSLPDATCKQLLNAGYDLENITLQQLLSHTSGITDYVDDAYFNFVDTHKNQEWKREDQVTLAMKKSPLGKPNTVFQYADINYVLLSQVIEKETNMPFYKAIRELLAFQKYNINETWFVTLEPVPKNLAPLAHQYWNQKKWDSYTINPSWDLYGGGGIAATLKDMALFYELLFSGQIIKDETLLFLMKTPSYLSGRDSYGLGIKKLNFNGYEAFYHGGFWGTDCMYVPSLQTTIAGYTLEKEHRNINAYVSSEILKIISKKNLKR